ncbi:hypothetical protein [Falsiporphyromonas endometrii]|uniref:Uncharacterized protein n=1 Tax=Falsiporphyromonas endometrii TaxID=1387297 RepID=A0ABV9K6M2_9PORP
MEISILLTILLMMISLGGVFFQGGKMCLVNEEQISDSVTIKYDLNNALYPWAVKLVKREAYLLNIVAASNGKKAAQTALIQPQNLKFEG